MPFNSPHQYHKTECEINGKRVKYDAYDSTYSDKGKASYEAQGFKYIGSSDKIWVNGVFQTGEPRMGHFFVKEAK